MPQRYSNVIRKRQSIAFHPSTKTLKKKIEIKCEFSFSLVYTDTIKESGNDLDVKKAMSGEIPASLFKKYDFIFDTVTALASGIFPESLKCANVNSIHKKDDPFNKKNYRPMNMLPLVSKIYERVMYQQTSNYFEPFSKRSFGRNP